MKAGTSESSCAAWATKAQNEQTSGSFRSDKQEAELSGVKFFKLNPKLVSQ